MSLACANLAYLYLSVPFIQMLKALAPVVTLLLSWAASLADPRVSTLGCVLVIAFGVFLAGVGEVRFVWAGFFVHCTLPFSFFPFFFFVLARLVRRTARLRLTRYFARLIGHADLIT